MIVNFRARGISRGTRKLARIPTLIIIKKYPPYIYIYIYILKFLMNRFLIKFIKCKYAIVTKIKPDIRADEY
jgi:hypothetical protein